MATNKKKMQEFEQKLARLSKRVEKLEDAASRPVPPSRKPLEPTDAELLFLESLKKLRGSRYETKNMRGALCYAGSVRFHDREYLYIKRHGLPEVVEFDFDLMGRIFSALSSPTRLLMLRSLLEGPRTSQELQEALGISSPGQLYHHLKDLQAAGLVAQSRRGHYRISSNKIVPILIILASAIDLASYGVESIDDSEVILRGGIKNESLQREKGVH